MELSTLQSIPIAKGLPIIGSTKGFFKQPLDFLIKSYKELGPIFKVKIINDDLIILAGLEANEFLTKNANNVLRADWDMLLNITNSEKFLVAVQGKEHVHLRRTLMRGYSPQMITSRFPKVVNLTENLLKQSCGKAINTVDFIRTIVTDQLGLLLANRAPGEYRPYIIDYLRLIMNVTFLKMWPKVMFKHPRYAKAAKKVDEFCDLVVKEHRENTGKEQPDLIDDILKAYDSKHVIFKGSDLMLNVLGPFFAGIDTVSYTLSTTIYALIQHPDILKKLRKEVNSVFANQIPTLKMLQGMRTTYGVVLEALRRYPVAFMLPRVATEDFTFMDKLVKKGSTVYMGQSITHFLPELFKDPYTFDIERFFPPRNEHKQKNAFSPYGIGAHRCLGARLAEIQMMLTVATFVKTVNFETVPNDYKLKMGILPNVGPEKKFKIKMSQRS